MEKLCEIFARIRFEVFWSCLNSKSGKLVLDRQVQVGIVPACFAYMASLRADSIFLLYFRGLQVIISGQPDKDRKKWLGHVNRYDIVRES